MREEVTWFTVSSEGYFLGTVALLNSLRLTGNEGPVVVLDVGLTEAQRARLAGHMKLVRLPGGIAGRPWLFKSYPRFFDPSGIAVLIDSDMIVTRSLGDVVDRARQGKICVFPDHVSQIGRWFEEWETAFGLDAPLRRQTYVNGGFIALSTRQWPEFLTRYWQVSECVPSGTMWSGAGTDSPFWGAEQDALNALLMSEIPPEGVVILPAEGEAHVDGLSRSRVLNARTLECSANGGHPSIVHYSMAPKAWDPRGWVRVRQDAYVGLFGRVCCGRDVSLRLEPHELPVWLRPGLAGRATLSTLDAIHGAAAGMRRRLPGRPSEAVLEAKRKLMGSRGR